MSETAERVDYESSADNYVFYRQFRAYELVAPLIRGKVLEVGSGNGYGLRLLSRHCDYYTAIDKYDTNINTSLTANVSFQRMTIPPLELESDYFDYVVCFQVIEHIQEDSALIAEIKRVLKPGGKLYMTTPNIKTTLTRNPWHIREYTIDEFNKLLSSSFEKVEVKGVYGDTLVMDYYNQHKASIQKLMKFDILNLQHRLPGWMLRTPYDILDKLFRNKSRSNSPSIVDNIKSENFYLENAEDSCLDLFGIAQA